MSSMEKTLLTAVLALALILAGTLGTGLHRDYARLRTARDELAESRAAWETTAAEKEALQAELKEVQDALKEAELTLQESTERAAALRSDIETLEAEIAALKADLNQSAFP